MRRVVPISLLLIAMPVSSAAASAPTTSFRAPGGKTYCLVSKAGGLQARCDVKSGSFTVPPKPSTCIDHSWGIGAFFRGNAKAEYVCTGQPLWLDPDPGEILAVGKSVKLGRASCTSLKSGIRCVNSASGHGFKISQQALKLF